MTADRLDEQAEARIREACPRSDMPTHDPFACHFCRIQRAAILADREARECHDRNHAGLREWLCGWRDDERFAPMTCGPKEWMGQDVALVAHQVQAAITGERAHADALAEALRYARRCGHSGFGVEGCLDRSCRALAAHDKRRGK